MQNAEGGVNGHKLVALVIDDQTSPTEIATAVQEADSKAFGIVSQSPLLFLAAKYPNQAGVPVTGTYDDGPEWGTQPYTNMFASDEGSVNPKYPVNTQIGDFLKAHGGTVLGSYGYGISPSSSRAAIAHRRLVPARRWQGRRPRHHRAVRQRGLHRCMRSSAKQKGINTMVPAMDANSNYALAEALKQAGVKLKATLYATGYEPDVINSPAWPDLQGAYFLLPSARGRCPTPAPSRCRRPWRSTRTSPRVEFPNFGQYEAWAGADLMIKGLAAGGAEPDAGRGHQGPARR